MHAITPEQQILIDFKRFKLKQLQHLSFSFLWSD